MNLEIPRIESIARDLDKTRQSDPLKPGETRLLEKYSKRLEEYRMKPDDFGDLYGQKEVTRDKLLVDKIKSAETTKTERGELLEGIIMEQAEQSDWFGENSTLVSVSDYDDRNAHGDLVLELKGADEKITRILIDVTTSVDEAKLNEKLNNSLSLIKDKRLSNIKYFQSESEEFRGRLINIPRVVIGMSPYLLRELCGEILEKKNQQENNPIQAVLLDQMESQLLTFWKLADSLHGESHEITKKLKVSYDIIRGVSAKKNSLRAHDYERKARDLTSRLLRY